MHVGLDCARHLEVDDKGNILHVDTTTREVRRDQNVGGTRAECLQRSLSLLLIFARMQGRGAPLHINNQQLS